MSFDNMNQLLRHIEELRAAKSWDEPTFDALYPEAARLAGKFPGAIDAFLGEGRRDWVEKHLNFPKASAVVEVELTKTVPAMQIRTESDTTATA